MKRAFLLYTGARFGLFLIFSALIWAISGLAGYEINGWLLVIAGFALSSLVGYVVLVGPRQELAEALAQQRTEEP